MTRFKGATPTPLPSFQHASQEEYAHFLQGYKACAKYRTEMLRWQKYFVRAYPNLNDWFCAPLIERVGSVGRMSAGKPTPASPSLSVHVRPYLQFLALRGYAPLDWEWLIATSEIRLDKMLRHPAFASNAFLLADEAKKLGYSPQTAVDTLFWSVDRLLLHTSITQVEQITATHLLDFREALTRFGDHPDVALFFGSAEHYDSRVHSHHLVSLHMLQTLLYHRGQIHLEPHRPGHATQPRAVEKPRMEAIIARYLAVRQLDQPGTVEHFDTDLHQFVSWLVSQHPALETWAEVTREHVLEYAEALNSLPNPKTHQLYAASTKRAKLSKLSLFFRDVAMWEWEDVPQRPLLLHGELPKLPQRIPRYIPEEELDLLMPAIRALECPYQRAALLIARWSGARREEIQRLRVDCLDSYPDGMPRLHLPAGKTKRERLVPLNQEAASAIRAVQALRKGERGLHDRQTGVETRYLFIHFGRQFSLAYLFEDALRKACSMAGLLTAESKATVTAHRFRHTVGTQLARKGARLRTIQKILGHESAEMSMVYIGITDEEVLQDYQTVLGPDAIIAGPGAVCVRSGALAESELRWLQEHYFQTELELGRCLRLPQEGPCECDLYLTCAKFVTTPQYAPRLRRRCRIEQELIEDAVTHGWEREVERHQCTVRRIEQLLADLGEPLDGPEATD